VHATPTAPGENAQAADDRSRDREENWVVAGVGDLGGDVVQPPRKRQADHDGGSGHIDRIAAVERIGGNAHLS
jgi:hypothetical protein